MRLTEKLDKDLPIYFAKNGNDEDETNTRSIIQKLGQLEDIEEELGIDLITLFKAQKENVWELVFDGYDENGKSIYKPRKNQHDIYIDLKQKALVGKWIGYEFKDYGKTWALTKEELENYA